MKTFASIVVEIGTMILVFWLLEWRDKGKRRVLLKHMGPAFVASGICSYIGAKYFGLAVFGRHSVSYGDEAAEAAIFLAAFGAVLFTLHFILSALFPRFMFVRENRKNG